MSRSSAQSRCSHWVMCEIASTATVPLAVDLGAEHASVMKGWQKAVLIAGMIVVIAVVTLPFWGMGPAVFLDSKRMVISRAVSPDGKRTAQVERIVVGGVPTIVVMVRPVWMPNWYLAGCAAASHYQNAAAGVHWTSNSTIHVRHTDARLYWNTGTAPFHNDPCENLSLTFEQGRPRTAGS